MLPDKIFQKSESFNSFLANTEIYFKNKFPTIESGNEVEFTIEVSNFRKKIYNHYNLNPTWTMGSYRDMFDIRETVEVVKARNSLKEHEDIYLLYSHLIGETYILDEEEQEYINNLKIIISDSSKEIILKKTFLNAIINVFKTMYPLKQVLPLLQEGWGDKVQERQEMSKRITKQLFLRLTQDNHIDYNLMRNVKNTKLRG